MSRARTNEGGSDRQVVVGAATRLFSLTMTPHRVSLNESSTLDVAGRRTAARASRDSIRAVILRASVRVEGLLSRYAGSIPDR
jgi:hypothetical protein